MKSKISPKIYHIALIVYCLIIFILSSIPGENFPEVDFKFSDKYVHIIIYAVLFVLFFYSLKNQSKNVKLQKSALEYSVLFTALYGITDELHQYFVPNRSCELYDWFADVAGALIMYFLFKFQFNKKRSAAVLFLLLFICGCSSSVKQDGNPKINISVAKEEAWLDLMPVTDEKVNQFGFEIYMNVENNVKDTNYLVRNLVIYLNNDTLENKKFSAEVMNTEGRTNIRLSQLSTESYLNKTMPKPDEAQFIFDIYKDSKKIRTIKTAKLKINKVY